MVERRAERRLAAILVADVVGYSRLMGLDEVVTRARLRSVIDDVMQPTITLHNGRLFKEIGDGFLAEFASVVDAVECAIQTQEAMNKRAEGEDEPITLRIGVNLGDVLVEGDDLHGDGVNVAARLEALAEPGGVCISRSARDQIRDKLDLAIEDMGEIDVKNIARPVRAFRVSTKPLEEHASKAVALSSKPKSKKTRKTWAAVVGVFFVIASFLGLLWFEPWVNRVASASVEDMALSLPTEPSVAVLPFDVAPSQQDDRLFADSLAEDLTRSLARVPGLFVIAFSSTERYRDAPEEPARIAESLGVAHIVRASLRRSENRVRIDAEMIDALSGRIVFAERYERKSEDLFALQDELVSALANRLSEDLGRLDEQKRFTDSAEAYLLWSEADYITWRSTPNAYDQSKALALRSLEIDPEFLRPKGVLAFIQSQQGYFRVVENPEESVETARLELSRLVAASPDDWYLRSLFAQAVMNTRDYMAATREFDLAIELDPSNARLLTVAALPLIFLGDGVASERRLRSAIRLNPAHGWLPDQLLGQALYLQERYEEAAESLLRARERNPRFIGNMWWRAAVLVNSGKMTRLLKPLMRSWPVRLTLGSVRASSRFPTKLRWSASVLVFARPA